MPQMPGTSGTAPSGRRDRAVAGGGADDLDERAGRTPAPNGAVVRVEGAHRDRDALGEAELRGPLRAQPARRAVGRVRLVVEPVAELRELRIEARQELLRRQPAPGVGVHRLVAGGADAALDPRAGRRRRRARPGRSRPARPSSRPRRRRRAPPSGSARSSTRTTRTSRCRRSGARYCGACSRRGLVIAAASSAPVWSFHSQAWAARFACHFGSSASGRFCASTGIGVEPVVSTPMPITRLRARSRPPSRRAASAAVTDPLEPGDVVGRVLPREVRVLRVEQDALVARRVVEHGACRARARPRSRRRARARSWCRSRRRS